MARSLDVALRLAKRSGTLFSLLSRTVVSLVGIRKSIRSNYHEYAERTYYKAKTRDVAEAVGSGLYVNGEIEVNGNTTLGENVHLHGLTVHGSGAVAIGDNVHVGAGCEILTANHNYDDGEAIPYDDTFVVEPVTIGDNVWFGIDVTVLPGVTIGEGAIVQAGSVVTDDIPDGAIVGGHPAEVFGRRDMEHYETLKAAGKFN